jgi:hypothetical protein
MVKCWRAIVAAAVNGGSGCCHHCGCCESRYDLPPPRLDGRPPLSNPPPAEVLPPVGPRPGTGAYEGS